MRKFLAISLLGLTLLTTSCISSIVSNAAKSSKVNNKMLLHSSPRVGDYAVYRGSTGSVQMTMKITGKRGGLYVITSDTGFGLSGQYMSTLLLELYVDRSGNVKKAYVVEGSGKTPLQIAQKGDDEYRSATRLSSSQVKAMGIPSSITVQAGTYSVKPVVYKSTKNGQDVRIVNLVNRRVKFGYVAALTYNKSGSSYEKVQSMELVEQGNKR